jgi:hypothetical protein
MIVGQPRFASVPAPRIAFQIDVFTERLNGSFPDIRCRSTDFLMSRKHTGPSRESVDANQSRSPSLS